MKRFVPSLAAFVIVAASALPSLAGGVSVDLTGVSPVKKAQVFAVLNSDLNTTDQTNRIEAILNQGSLSIPEVARGTNGLTVSEASQIHAIENSDLSTFDKANRIEAILASPTPNPIGADGLTRVQRAQLLSLQTIDNSVERENRIEAVFN